MNEFELIRTGNAEVASFCTMPTNTRAEKVALYNATQGKSELLIRQVNKIIKLAHVYAEPTTTKFIDEDTEEMVEKPSVKMILIDTDGNAFRSSAMGIAQSLQRIFSIFGMPEDWEEGFIPVMVKPLEGKHGATYILEVADV